MSYEALTLMQGVERSKRWGVGFYSFYHNTLVNSQLKLEKAYPKDTPDYLKPATRSPNPLAVPAGLVGDGYLLPSAAALSDARRPIPPLFAAAISAQLAPSADWSSYLLAASAAAMSAPATATTATLAAQDWQPDPNHPNSGWLKVCMGGICQWEYGIGNRPVHDDRNAGPLEREDGDEIS